MGGNVGVAGLVVNKDDGTGEAQNFASSVGIPTLASIPAHDDIRKKSANYEIIGYPGGDWGSLFEELGQKAADAPPVMPNTLDHESLLGLFKGDDVGREVVLEPASMADMCGGEPPKKESLEVVYENV
jgi:chlorophyllide a reductase subunit X